MDPMVIILFLSIVVQECSMLNTIPEDKHEAFPLDWNSQHIRLPKNIPHLKQTLYTYSSEAAKNPLLYFHAPTLAKTMRATSKQNFRDIQMGHASNSDKVFQIHTRRPRQVQNAMYKPASSSNSNLLFNKGILEATSINDARKSAQKPSPKLTVINRANSNAQHRGSVTNARKAIVVPIRHPNDNFGVQSKSDPSSLKSFDGQPKAALTQAPGEGIIEAAIRLINASIQTSTVSPIQQNTRSNNLPSSGIGITNINTVNSHTNENKAHKMIADLKAFMDSLVNPAPRIVPISPPSELLLPPDILTGDSVTKPLLEMPNIPNVNIIENSSSVKIPNTNPPIAESSTLAINAKKSMNVNSFASNMAMTGVPLPLFQLPFPGIQSFNSNSSAASHASPIANAFKSLEGMSPILQNGNTSDTVPNQFFLINQTPMGHSNTPTVGISPFVPVSNLGLNPVLGQVSSSGQRNSAATKDGLPYIVLIPPHIAFSNNPPILSKSKPLNSGVALPFPQNINALQQQTVSPVMSFLSPQHSTLPSSNSPTGIKLIGLQTMQPPVNFPSTTNVLPHLPNTGGLPFNNGQQMFPVATENIVSNRMNNAQPTAGLFHSTQPELTENIANGIPHAISQFMKKSLTNAIPNVNSQLMQENVPSTATASHASLNQEPTPTLGPTVGSSNNIPAIINYLPISINSNSNNPPLAVEETRARSRLRHLDLLHDSLHQQRGRLPPAAAQAPRSALIESAIQSRLREIISQTFPR